MGDLASRSCVPCRAGTPPLRGEALSQLGREMPDWKIVDDHHLERTFLFPNFRDALEFTNRVGAIAEAEGHHPDILLRWGRVTVTIWTHTIDGLTESDFILAAKVDRLGASPQGSPPPAA